LGLGPGFGEVWIGRAGPAAVRVTATGFLVKIEINNRNMFWIYFLRIQSFQ
jgi:hypothetical protein